jgi:hypothetical protein
MTHPRGRTGHGPALRGVRAAACVAVALAGAVGGCARPGDNPSGTPERSVTVVASAAPGPRASGAVTGLVPGTVTGGCGGTGVVARPTGSPGRRAPAAPSPPGAPSGSPIPPAAPSGSPVEPTMGAEDARDRARRVLEQQRSHIPRHSDVPADVAARAAECVVLLRAELSLRRAAHGTLTPDDVRAALTAARLTGAVVHRDLRFAASTGEACVVGTADPAEAAIAPLPPDGGCRP